jgi:hypothetical protein
VDNLFDDRADDFGAAGVVAAVWKIRRSIHGQTRFSVRAGTTTGTRSAAWPAMICSSRTGTLSANRYKVSFTEVLSARFYRSTAPPL